MTNVNAHLKGMTIGRSKLTGRLSMTRKLTVNEGLKDEKRVCQRYHGVYLQSEESKVLSDCLVIEGLSADSEGPLSLRLTSMNGQGFLSEDSAQIAETVLVILEAAAYASGREIKDYAQEVLRLLDL